MTTLTRAVAVLLVFSFLLLACGGANTLPESRRKAFFTEFRAAGDAADKELEAAFPSDEDARMKAFRDRIEAVRGELLAKHGITEAYSREILAEAHSKGW